MNVGVMLILDSDSKCCLLVVKWCMNNKFIGGRFKR